MDAAIHPETRPEREVPSAWGCDSGGPGAQRMCGWGAAEGVAWRAEAGWEEGDRARSGA